MKRFHAMWMSNTLKNTGQASIFSSPSQRKSPSSLSLWPWSIWSASSLTTTKVLDSAPWSAAWVLTSLKPQLETSIVLHRQPHLSMRPLPKTTNFLTLFQTSQLLSYSSCFTFTGSTSPINLRSRSSERSNSKAFPPSNFSIFHKM